MPATDSFLRFVIRLSCYGLLAILPISAFAQERAKLLNELIEFSSPYRTERYNNLLQRYAQLRGDNLCLNTFPGARQVRCIDIVVVKHSATTNPPPGRFKETFQQLYHNATAFEPSLVLIDEQWLDTILVNTVSHYLFATRMVPDNLESAFVQARYQLFINMRRTYLSDANYARWLKPLSVVADGHISELTAATPSHYDPVEQQLLILSLSVFLEHEIAHLDQTSPFLRGRAELEKARETGSMTGEAYQQRRLSMQREEERRADQVALDRAEKLMNSRVPVSAGSAEARAVFAKLLMVGMASLFRDRFLFYAMDGFRGMRSEDVVFEFRHNECNDERFQGNFNDPDKILGARERPMPILTQTEFDARKAQLRSEGSSQATHDHYLIRSQNIADRIRSNKKSSSFAFLDGKEQLALLDALNRNQPALAFNVSKAELFQPLSDAPMKNVLEVSGALGKIEKAVICPTRSCFVGYLKDKLGYIELAADKDQLAELRWMVKVGGYSQEQYLRLMVDMMALFLRVGGKQGLESMVEMRGPIRCGISSKLIDTGDRVYYVTTANRDGWIYVRIFSPKVLAVLRGESTP